MPPENVRRQVVDPVRIDLHAAQPVQRLAPGCGHSAGRPRPSAARRHCRRRRRPCAARRPRVLMNDAPVGAQQHPPARVGQGIDIHQLAQPDRHSRRGLRSGASWPERQRQQRRLARAGFANDAQHLAGPKLEIHIGDQGDAPRQSGATGRRPAGSAARSRRLPSACRVADGARRNDRCRSRRRSACRDRRRSPRPEN